MARPTHLALAAALTALAAPAPAQESRPTSRPSAPAAADDLAARVAAAAGADGWDDVTRLRFTWRHVPRGGDGRSYDWDVPAGRVAVTTEEGEVTVPVAGWPEGGAPDEARARAHQAFVNDSFWFLFPLHARWDEGLETTDLGEVPVPGLEDLGPRRALELRYAADEGGYTPGDVYVLYLDADDRPVAWAFHKAGADAPTLVTTCEVAEHGPLTVPVRFTAGGREFIAIEDVEVEVAGSE